MEKARNFQVSNINVEYDETEENLSFLTNDILQKLRSRNSVQCLKYKKSLKSVIEEAKRELDNNYFKTDITSSEEYVDYDNIIFSQKHYNDISEPDYIEMK